MSNESNLETNSVYHVVICKIFIAISQIIKIYQLSAVFEIIHLNAEQFYQFEICRLYIYIFFLKTIIHILKYNVTMLLNAHLFKKI